MPSQKATSAPTPRSRVRRHPERAAYDADVVRAILADGFVCHVAFTDDDAPVVVPTAYAPFEGGVGLHGSPKGRMIARLASGAPACIAVTHLDGLVLARSAMHHSMNYRSVVLFARGAAIVDPARKRAALDAFVDHVVPGRRASIRPPTDAELAATGVVWFPLDEASAKVRAGPPLDLASDLALPVWAGTIALRVVAGPTTADPALAADVPTPRHVAEWPLREELSR